LASVTYHFGQIARISDKFLFFMYIMASIGNFRGVRASVNAPALRC
jgi:hypothetical protein